MRNSRLATKKLSDVELDRKELSTKFDEANQTIGALRFENNFLAGWEDQEAWGGAVSRQSSIGEDFKR